MRAGGRAESRDATREAILQRDGRSDGFSLIELMVVVMVLAVLLAIGLPTFLGFRKGAQDTAAQASLTSAAKLAYTVLVEDEAFPPQADLLALMPTLEPSIEWLDHNDSSTGPHQVSIDTHVTDELALASLSESGTCYYLRVVRGSPLVRSFTDAAANCRAHDFRNGPDTGW
jgi:prepilin-type N-terminal cleavage/methylation domain-containing protein